MEYYVRVKWNGTGGELWDKIAKLMPVVRVGEAFVAKKSKKATTETPEQTMVKRVRPTAHLHTPQMLELAATRRAEAETARKATCVNMLTAIMMNHQYVSLDFLVREMNKTVLRPFKSKKWTLSNIEPYYVAALEFLTSATAEAVQSVAQDQAGI